MQCGSSESNRVRRLLVATGVVVALPAQAAVLTWTNTQDGHWNVAAHWDPNRVPSTEDIAVIAQPGTYTVTLNTHPTIAGLILGGQQGTQTLATAGRTLTLNGAGDINLNGRLRLSGGALSGTNLMRLAGAMTWESGAIDTNTTLVVGPGATVVLASAGNQPKLLYGCITNAGLISWRMYGNFGIGGPLHNLPGGVFEAQVENRSITKTSDRAVIVNAGLFRKSTGDGNLPCDVPLHNQGTVEVALGTLTFEGGSRLESGSRFVGAGQTRLGPGTHTIDGDLQSDNLGLQGGTIAGTGRLSGQLTWAAGTVAAGAALTVTTHGHLLLSSPGNDPKFLAGHLTNAGTVTFSTYGNFGIAGTFHNLAGALFDVQTANRVITKTDPTAVIINEGVLRRSASGTPARCEVPIRNRGMVEVLEGTLVLADTFTDAAGTISLAGARLDLTQPLSLAGGLLTGWGTVTADVLNAGCIRPSLSNGTLTIRGTCDQSLAGRLEFELAGTSPGISQGRLDVTGAATLRGSIGVLWHDGYVPPPGTEFPVLTCNSRSGQFCCFDNFIRLGQGWQLTPVYGATAVTLRTTAAPEPTTVPLRVTVEDGALVCWPAEFTGYELQQSTDLGRPDWTTLPGVTNRLYEAAPLVPVKFYRLHRP